MTKKHYQFMCVVLISAVFFVWSISFPLVIETQSSVTYHKEEVLSANLTLPIQKLTASSNGYNSIRISWEAIKGASAYELYVAKGSSTTYTLIKSQTSTYYTHSSLSTNTKYSYKVRFYNLSGSTKRYSTYSNIAYAIPLPSVVSNVSVVSSGYTSIKVSWNSVLGASGYQVSMSNQLNGTYTVLPNTSSTYLNLTKLKTNETLYFKVRAYRTVSYKPVYGLSSIIVSGKALPSAPSVSISSLNATSVKLSWSAVAGATGYRLLSYNTLTKSYDFKGDILNTSTSLSGYKTGSEVYIKVIPYILMSGEKILGAESSLVHTKPVPEMVSGLKVSSTSVSSISLSWTSVFGATGYEIYRATSYSGTYTKIATSHSNTYVSSGLSFNKTYYFKVKATTQNENGLIYGSLSSYLSGKTLPTMVNLSVNPASSTSTKLSWIPVSGASGYEIYFSVGSTYSRYYKTITSTSYIHTSLKIGTKYTYRVRAYKLYGTTKIYGPYSSYVSCIPDYSKEELLSITSKSLSTLLTKVSSQETKNLVLKVKTAIDNYLKDPTYDFDSDARVARKMFNQLSASDKVDLTVQGTLTLNLSHLDRLKVIFGY